MAKETRLNEAIPPICLSCKHWKPESEKPICDAFPKGIPLPILDSMFDHRQPYNGDHDIRFEQNPVEAEPPQFSMEWP